MHDIVTVPSAFGRGPAHDIDITGVVSGVDPRGVMTIDAGGRQVWTAQPGASSFKVGDRVHGSRCNRDRYPCVEWGGVGHSARDVWE